MKRIFYSIIIGDILLTALFVFAFVLPFTGSIRRSAEAFRTKHQEFERFQNFKEEVRSFKEFAEEYAPDIAALRASFVDRDIPLDFVKFLERNAAKGDVKISIAPGVVKKEGARSLSFLEFQIQGTGPYAGVMHLMKNIERAPFATSLVSASVQGAEQGVRFSATLKALVR